MMLWIINLWLSAPSFATWTTYANMPDSRIRHNAVLLDDESMLIAGGCDPYYEKYDFPTLLLPKGATTFQTVGALNEFRRSATMLKLDNGKVLIAGGEGLGGYLTSTELYDPATGRWKLSGSMAFPRVDHVMVKLANGKMLIAGGWQPQAATELYDPSTGLCSLTSPLSTARAGLALVAHPSIDAIAIGGFPDMYEKAVNTVSFYRAASDDWIDGPPLNEPRGFPTATMLPNDRLVVAGGLAGGVYDTPPTFLVSVEIFNGYNWSVATSIHVARSAQIAFINLWGDLVIAGGSVDSNFAGTAIVERYDFTRDLWTFDAPLQQARTVSTVVKFANGNVIMPGGDCGPHAHCEVELYPNFSTLAPTSAFPSTRNPTSPPTPAGIPFETVWNISATTNSTLTLPLYSTSYDIVVDWNDSMIVHYITLPISHMYDTEQDSSSLSSSSAAVVMRTIKIWGVVKGLRLKPTPEIALALHRVNSWGDFRVDHTSVGMFAGCANLESVPAFEPPYIDVVGDSDSDDGSNINISIGGDIVSRGRPRNSSNSDSRSYSNTNAVMDYMFEGCSLLNTSLSWDLTGVVSLAYMFANNKGFNQPLHFVVPDVVSMESMFENASKFDQKISLLTPKLMQVAKMFQNAHAMNHAVVLDTSVVQDMSYMFANAVLFNQPLTFPNTSALLHTDWMFANTKNFDALVRFGDFSRVQTMVGMFAGSGFNQKLELNTVGCDDMSSVFLNATRFNQAVGFDVVNVKSFRSMFEGAVSFNQPLSFNIQSHQVDVSLMLDGCKSLVENVVLMPAYNVQGCDTLCTTCPAVSSSEDRCYVRQAGEDVQTQSRPCRCLAVAAGAGWPGVVTGFIIAVAMLIGALVCTWQKKKCSQARQVEMMLTQESTEMSEYDETLPGSFEEAQPPLLSSNFGPRQLPAPPARVLVLTPPTDYDFLESLTARKTNRLIDFTEFRGGKVVYRVVRALGEGNFGAALHCCDSKANDYVVKVQFCFNQHKQEGPLREAALLAGLPRSVHLLSLLDFFYESDRFFCIVVSYCSGGTLALEIVLRPNPSEVLRILRELCLGLSTLHEANIVHRDVKPDNIFFQSQESRTVVLGDMGLSRVMVGGYYDSSFGHKLFKPPEIQFGKFSNKSDMWAVGCVGLELLSGESMVSRFEKKALAFGQQTQEEIDEEIEQSIGHLKEHVAYRLVVSMLRINVRERPTAVQVSLTMVPD